MQYWNGIKKDTAKATHWVDKTTSGVGHDIAGGAKSVVKELNPAYWHF